MVVGALPHREDPHIVVAADHTMVVATARTTLRTIPTITIMVTTRVAHPPRVVHSALLFPGAFLLVAAACSSTLFVGE